jgi:hypothetical protein
MKKTAMQDMIEWIEQRFNNPQETEVFKKATELLEKEKEQIIKAIDVNERVCVDYCNRIASIIADSSIKDTKIFKVDKESGINYYNQTFNQNK